MKEKWKCHNCGGINPAGQETCLGCGTQNLPPELLERNRQLLERNRLERRERQSEAVVSFIKSKSNSEAATKWEYCLLFTGSLATEGDAGPHGGLLHVASGDFVDLPEDTFLVAIRELGAQGWEIIEAFSFSDLERQYPVKNLRPMWSYMLDAALKAPPRGGIYEYETISEATGIFFLLKRPLPMESG